MEPPQGPRPVPPPRRPSGERRAMSPPGGEQREFWEIAPDGSSPPVRAVPGESDKGQRRERSSTQTFCIVMEKRVPSHEAAPPGARTAARQEGAPWSGGTAPSHTAARQEGAPWSGGTAPSHTAARQEGAPWSGGTAPSHTAARQEGAPWSGGTVPSHTAARQEGAPWSGGTVPSHTAARQEGAPWSGGTAPSHTAARQEGAPWSGGTAPSHTAARQEGAPWSGGTVPNNGTARQEGAPWSGGTAPSHTAARQEEAPWSGGTVPSHTAARQEGAPWSGGTAPSHTAARQEGAPWSGGTAPSHTAARQEGAPQTNETAPPAYQSVQSHETAPSHTVEHQERSPRSPKTTPPGHQIAESHAMPPGRQTASSHIVSPWIQEPDRQATAQSDITTALSGETIRGPRRPDSQSDQPDRSFTAAQSHDVLHNDIRRSLVTSQDGDTRSHLVKEELSSSDPTSTQTGSDTVTQRETFPSSAAGRMLDVASERDQFAQSQVTPNFPPSPGRLQTPPLCSAVLDHESVTRRDVEPQDPVSPSVISLAMERIKHRNLPKSSTMTGDSAVESSAQQDHSVPPARELVGVTSANQEDLIPSFSNKSMLISGEQPSIPSRESRSLHRKSSHPTLDIASSPVSPSAAPTGEVQLETSLSIRESPSRASYKATAISSGVPPSQSTPGEAFTGGIPPLSNLRASALSTGGVLPHFNTGAAQLSTDGTPPLSNTEAATLSIGGTPPHSETGTAPLSAASTPPLSNTGAASLSSGGAAPLNNTGAAPLSSGGAAPLNNTGAAPLSSGGAAPLSSGGAAPLSSGGTPPLSNTGAASLSSGGTPPLSNTGAASLSSGGTPPLSNTGAAPLSSGGAAPLNNTGAAPLSSGGAAPLSSGGAAPLSSGGTPPLSNTGAAPLSNTGAAPLSTEGTPPVSTGGAAPLSNTGAAPLSTGGLSNSSPGASSASSTGLSKLSPVRVLDPPSPHRNKSKPPLPIPPRSNLYPGPLSEYDSSLRHETASLASYRSKAPAPDTLSYLDSVSLMSGTMESLSMLDDASSLGSDSEINGMAYRKTDKYGFLGGSQFSGNGENIIPVEIARQRELKWLDMFNHWDKWIVRRFQKVKLRCRKGIPSSMRSKAWQLLSNSHELLVKNPGKFDEMERQPGDPKWLDVIEKDLHRQFPFHEMFAARGGHGQQDLYRILKAYTIYRPEEGYCQAQAPVAAVLLMHMPAEQAFWCLVQICDKYLPGYYSAGLEAIQLDGEIFFVLLRRISPTAYRHLKKFKIDPILYMTEWFMCIFSRTLPWSSVLRVWDMFFCEGVKIVFRVGLVLLKHTLGSAEKLRSCQGMYETMEKLRSLPTQCMLEDTLLPEVSSLPIADALIERESNTQLRKWRENRGELQYHPSRRLHGARQIHEEKMRLNPALSGSRLSLSSLRRPSPPSTPSLVVHPESVVVSEGLRPALPSPTSNKAPLGPPKSENKKVKEKQREEEKRREKEEREKHEREKKREKEERELERKREKEQKRAQKMDTKQKKERRFSFRRKEQSSPAPDIQRKGGKGADGEEGTVHDTYF